MYDEDIKIDADANALAQLIISIVQAASKSETDEKIDALQAKIDSLENQIEEFDIHDHSYDVGEIALEHLTNYGGLQDTVVEIINEHDFSDAEIPVASGTTFTVTVD
jgi:hypothetical protein